MNKNNIISLSVFISIVFLGVCYYSFSGFAITINRFCEMLNTGNSKGIMMYYYEFGNINYITSILITSLQTLIPVFPKNPVIEANIVYFGNTVGFILTILGVLLGSSYAYLIGSALSNIFKLKKIMINKCVIYVVVIFQFISVIASIVNYIAGTFKLDYKKYILAVMLGQMLYCIYKIY